MKKIILSMLCLFIVSITTELYGQKVEAEYLESVELANIGTTNSVGSFTGNGGQWTLYIPTNPFGAINTYQIREKSQWKIGLVNTQTNLPAEIDLQKGVVVINGKETYTILKSNKRRPRVTFFQSKNFEGKTLALNSDESASNLKDYSGFDDNIASMKIPPELKVIIHQHPGFGGQKIVLYPGQYKLCPMYNRISSIEIIELEPHEIGKPMITLYQHTKKEHDERGSGVAQTLGIGDWDRADLDCHDCWSEMYVEEGARVILYEEEGFRNGSLPKTTKRTDNNKGLIQLGYVGYGDNGKRIRSIKVLPRSFDLYDYQITRLVSSHQAPASEWISHTVTSRNNAKAGDANSIDQMNTSIAKSYENSWEITNANDLSIGTAVTTSIGTSPTTGFFTGTDIAVEITASIETTISNSKTEAKVTSTLTSTEYTIPVQPSCRGGVRMVVIPTTEKYEGLLFYQEIDDNGKIVKNGMKYTEPIEVTIKTATKGDISSMKYCDSDMKDAMLNNSWKVEKVNDRKKEGTFSELPGREGGLIWTPLSGAKINLLPNYPNAEFSSKPNDIEGHNFQFSIKDGELDALIYKGDTYYPTPLSKTTTVTNPPATTTTTESNNTVNTTSTPTGLTSEKIQAPTVKYVTVSDNGGSTSIGSFEEVSSKVWVCIINGNSVRFVETARDDWSIYLNAEDGSRTGMINLWTRKVLFDGVEKYQVLKSSKNAK